MAKRIQLRRGTTAQSNAFTGAVGEVTVDTDKDVLVVHDGVTAGGFPVAARANADGTISLIKKDGTVVGLINSAGLFNNTYTSTSTDQALTANMGKIIYDQMNYLHDKTLGYSQTWQDVTAGRTMGTTYTNSTGKPIAISFIPPSDPSQTYVLSVSGIDVAKYVSSSVYVNLSTITAIVPNGATYKITGISGRWLELR